MSGYLGQPDATAETFTRGWLHSGDLGFLDEEATVFFVDRKKDMIKTGGENVASLEVSLAIMRHPAVSECTVVGLPHPRWTEAVTAFVKVQDGHDLDEAALSEHCRQHLAPFKIPKRFLFVDEFPRTATRKIRNVQLRQEYKDLYA
jgi:acyl-CoA synthetase (AMP-forming)/AMP-acid ligase II